MVESGALDSAAIRAAIARIRRYLPSQGPIQNFVHHNTLQAFQHENLSFHEAIRQSSRLTGSCEYLPIDEYRRRFAIKEISEDAIARVLAPFGERAENMRAALFDEALPNTVKRPGFRAGGYLYSMVNSTGIILEEDVHPLVFRLVANFLDQGIASVSFAQSGDDFWSALRGVLSDAPLPNLGTSVRRRIGANEPVEAIVKITNALLPSGADASVFLLEILMAARGWAGLIAKVEEKPSLLVERRAIALEQYLALYLCILEERLAQKKFNRAGISLNNPNLEFFREKCPAENRAEQVARLWHEAFELTFYLQALAALRANTMRSECLAARERGASMQALFCIDDRESSLRRHLEELSTTIETFGTPGYYGIDAVFLAPHDKTPVRLCPASLETRFIIRGIDRSHHGFSFERSEMNFWHRAANSLWLGWLISLVFGIGSLVRLLLAVHWPTRSFATASSNASDEQGDDLHYERSSEDETYLGYRDGYTDEEMAERVYNVFHEINLVQNFARLVVIIGHGSSSTNNPYFAAYDCGACSGRPGAINARIFSRMANRRDVRTHLARRGIAIPETTYFVGALHDTTRDEFTVFDERHVPDQLRSTISDLKILFSRALQLNALERTRRFAISDFQKHALQSLSEVRRRSEMLFEPRPEYNHATNALAIVARRRFSEGLFFDRRAFFNTYEPQRDQEGGTLTAILEALIPVCAGINLEYLFSRVDEAVFSAGSKLPHNIFSMLGVGNGVEGDLRTGLPLQMTEIHDPIRLLVVVEQKLEIVKKVLAGAPKLHSWISLGWVRFCVHDYTTQKYFFAEGEQFNELAESKLHVEEYRDSFEAFNKKRDNIVPAVIRGLY